MKSWRFIWAGFALIAGAPAWAGGSASALSSARQAATSLLAMGPGMMSGGMMGGYGAGMNRGDGSRGASQTPEPNSRGARLFAQACALCHALPDPRAHTAQQWPAVVSRMTLHMRESRFRPLEREQVEEIDAYLERHAAAVR